jgi:hypothetical protein
MPISKPTIPGANSDGPTQFDPRPSQWPDGPPTADHHVVPHDFGTPEVVRPEDGPGSA